MHEEGTNAFFNFLGGMKEVEHKKISREVNIQEASRCLNCKIPFCEKGCPVDTKVRDIIQGVK